MRILAAIGRFAYDLVVGDSWALSLCVAAVLAVSAALVHADLLPPPVLAVGTGLAVAVAAVAVVVSEARGLARERGD